MYKDRHNIVASDSEQSGPVFVKVDDVSESPLNEIVEDPQPEESTDTPQPSPPKALRRSDRFPNPNQKYLNYLFGRLLVNYEGHHCQEWWMPPLSSLEATNQGTILPIKGSYPPIC
ncbi:hypothetical protein ACS0TY_019776 [Phlomoides rotata]